MILKFAVITIIYIVIRIGGFSKELNKKSERDLNTYSFIHFPPNLLKHDYINHPENPCYNEKIAKGETTTRVFIYTTIKLKNSIFYDMIRCALFKSQFYLGDEIIYQIPYNRKEFCEKTIKNQYSHYQLHLWLEWSKELKVKSKKYQNDHFIHNYSLPCSPNIRSNDDVYIHMQLIGVLNELTEDSGEILRVLKTKSSDFINLTSKKTTILSNIDSNILPFVVVKTITGDGFGYNEFILPNLMNQLFDFFDVANLLTNQPKWRNITNSNFNYMPPLNRYDKNDVLQKEFAFINTDS